MPQLYFSTKTFSGAVVRTDGEARRHARLMHETRNICRMNTLSVEEKQAAYKLLLDEG